MKSHISKQGSMTKINVSTMYSTHLSRQKAAASSCEVILQKEHHHQAQACYQAANQLKLKMASQRYRFLNFLQICYLYAYQLNSFSTMDRLMKKWEADLQADKEEFERLMNMELKDE